MKMTRKEIVSSRLREARDITGETQRQVGETLNISRGTISGYETGQRMPSIEMMCDFAQYYDTEIGYLLGMDVEVSNSLKAKESDLVKAKYAVKSKFLDLSQLSDSARKEILSYYEYLKLKDMKESAKKSSCQK